MPDALLSRLLDRAVEIGDQSAVRDAVMYVLREGGPLSQPDQVTSASGHLLVQLAVLAPDLVLERVKDWLGALSDSELAGLRYSRFYLVRALEKVVWHSETFEAAADLLLRLAVNENEDWANNSTGSWTDLFQVLLPGTAADPSARPNYLFMASSSHDARVRALAARAAAKALEPHETIAASGEVQGGRLVEPRGRPKQWGAYRLYRNCLIDILAQLVADEDREVAEAALNGLVRSIHGCLEIDDNRSHLAAVLPTLGVDALREVRRELFDLKDMLTEAAPGDARLTALDALRHSLPEAKATDRLWVLAHTRSWRMESAVLTGQIVEAAQEMGAAGQAELLKLLEEGDLPAAHQVGRALAVLGVDDATVAMLGVEPTGSISRALAGYLWQRVEQGHEGAFDDFIESYQAPAEVHLELTVSGPATERSKERVAELADVVPVWLCASRLMSRWGSQLEEDEACAVLDKMVARLAGQDDYNRLVDFLAFYLHGRDEVQECLHVRAWDLLCKRLEFPDVAGEEWDWGQIARRMLPDRADALASLLADLAEQDALSAYPGSEDVGLFKEATSSLSPDEWIQLMDRVAAGSWRLQAVTSDWLGESVDVEVARSWVSGDPARAECLAIASPLGDAELSQVAGFLIEEFGHDDDVIASLAPRFVVRHGAESDWLRSLIEQTDGYMRREGVSQAVGKWARARKKRLEIALSAALEKEAEGYF